MADTRKVLKPTQVFKAKELEYELDARVANVFGQDLHNLIFESVKATQYPLTMALPSRLILSHKQFISVENNTEAMDATADRIYLTPLNVMEVEIDQDYQQVDEDILDVMIGYESEDDMGITKDQAKGIILENK